ncbi:hypothetical protein [Halorubrum kocurii]|uniref:Uncharacterized protein n=1 Tax=Halorubrum kocurii JCM 14978 TaxID=1230456 RepID=M0P9R3_9EURY|nr:hypothetical protein [Halorubrum kocurii]EMA65545.1 hypothetical protein C468_06173 [Halorubrum kocurii JCM 14978]
MAHKLAHNGGSDRSAADSDTDGKRQLNRRQYVKLGTATAASLLIGGASVGSTGATTDAGDSFWTDFSEGM